MLGANRDSFRTMDAVPSEMVNVSEDLKRRRLAFDALAEERERWQTRNRAYYRAIEQLVGSIVPIGAEVLEIGCGTGDLLAALKPSVGVGVDFSERMIARARQRHGYEFIVDDAETLNAPGLAGRTFDYIVLSDVVGVLADVWAAIRAVRRFCHPRTRLVVTYYNFVWEPLLKLAERVGLKMALPQQNWLGMQDIEGLLTLNHFDIVRSGTAQLLPFKFPFRNAINQHLSLAPGLRHLALTQFFVCRLAGGGGPIAARDYSCSVIVPCKNERGNIDAIVDRTPNMGRSTEIIFVDGSSQDGTVQAIEAHLQKKTRAQVKLLHQGCGRGKGDAVRQGFAAATGDILFILDADLTVPPEDLPKFYFALSEGRAEFVNGSRLVYPMEGEAMRFLNSLGNKLFGLAMSATIEQRLKDTLCGTKVLFRRDYERIVSGRAFFGELDPFGDFDLLLGAAKLNLKIAELPIRYRARTYGETKISRFRDGLKLLQMTARAYRKFRAH